MSQNSLFNKKSQSKHFWNDMQVNDDRINSLGSTIHLCCVSKAQKMLEV